MHVKHLVEIRNAAPRTLHNRYMIVDSLRVFNVSQSIKDIAKRAAASVTQDRTDMAVKKVEFLQDAWRDSKPVTAA